MGTRKKARWIGAILCATLCVAFATVAAIWWFTPQSLIRSVDPRFHVLSARVLRNPSDTFYMGNQLEGRIREALHYRWQLKVKTLDAISASAVDSYRKNGSTFAMRFSLAVTPRAFQFLEAELVHSSGTVTPLGIISPIHGANPYWLTVNLDSGRTNSGNYILKLKQANVCVAEVELKDLPRVEPYHIGPNAF